MLLLLMVMRMGDRRAPESNGERAGTRVAASASLAAWATARDSSRRTSTCYGASDFTLKLTVVKFAWPRPPEPATWPGGPAAAVSDRIRQIQVPGSRQGRGRDSEYCSGQSPPPGPAAGVSDSSSGNKTTFSRANGTGKFSPTCSTISRHIDFTPTITSSEPEFTPG
jgi:hypothetical protein